MSVSAERIRLRETKLTGLAQDIRSGHIWLWRTVLAMLFGCALMYALQHFDVRVINGVSVWDKPAKFFLSLAVQYGTVSWGLSQLPKVNRTTHSINAAVWLMLIAGWLEMGYIIFRAWRGEASHFNATTAFAALAYALMGVGALTLTFTAAFIGWNIWAMRGLGVWTEAAGLALLLGAVLGTIAGAYMSAHGGHWVGGAQTDAGGLPLFNWSMSGGDLRVAHFVGLHASQLIALSALSGDRRVVYAASVAMILLTTIIFVMGVLGTPLLRA